MVVRVEKTPIRVQIRDRKLTAGGKKAVETPEDGLGVRHVVECHAADHGVVRALQAIALFQIMVPGPDIRKPLLHYLGLENIQHPLGSIDSGDGLHEGLETEGDKPGSSSEIQDIHFRA